MTVHIAPITPKVDDMPALLQKLGTIKYSSYDLTNHTTPANSPETVLRSVISTLNNVINSIDTNTLACMPTQHISVGKMNGQVSLLTNIVQSKVVDGLAVTLAVALALLDRQFMTFDDDEREVLIQLKESAAHLGLKYGFD